MSQIYKNNNGGGPPFPGAPGFLAHQLTSQSNVTGDGTPVIMVADSVIIDKTSNYNNATGVFTAPVTGFYSFTATVYMTGIEAANTAQISLFAGSLQYWGQANGAGVIMNNEQQLWLNNAWNLYVTAGTGCYVQLIAFINATKNVTIQGNASPDFGGWFSGVLIG